MALEGEEALDLTLARIVFEFREASRPILDAMYRLGECDESERERARLHAELERVQGELDARIRELLSTR